MFFSIIIPLYNAEKYIDECLESIINQSEKSFEVIIINDGSTDNSKKIAESFEAKHENVRLINQDNIGLLHTRCVGINNANGNYIVFVDSDDKLNPDALKILKKNLTNDNLDMIIYNHARLDQKKKQINTKAIFPKDTVFVHDKKNELYKRILTSSDLNSMCFKVVRKECFDCEEILAYPDVKNGEDLLHTLPVITNAKTIKYIDDTLYLYRINNQSMTRTFDDRNYKGAILRNKTLKNYLIKWGMNDKKNHLLLDKRFLKEIAKLTMYTKSDIKYREKSYYSMLSTIKNDSFFKNVYLDSFSELSSIYKLPNWLIFKGKFRMLKHFKKIVFHLRK